jgi:pyridoxal phosphate enzyme (YggS family)
VATFDRVHTVDSVALADALAAEAVRAGRRLPVLLQVNVTGEPARRGVGPEALLGLAGAVLALPALRLDGLMTIPPPEIEPERRRLHFRRLRELRDHVQNRLGVELPHLSMGMSDDFAIAIEEGATMVRLGRALFGPRGPGSWREGS